MKLAFKKTKIFLFLAVAFVLPLISFAQNTEEAPKDLFPCEGSDCKFEHLVLLVQGVTTKLFLYGMILSSMIFAYAGFLYLTSQSNPGNRSRANSIFVNVLIGIAIMMSAWVIVKLVLTALVKDGSVWSPF